ncbi:MAG TPA: adenine phosphoribosyltransferase [Planctomycetota bacterium]
MTDAAGTRSTDYARYLRDVPDFPEKGVLFKDITPLLQDPAAMRAAVQDLSELVRPLRPDRIAAIESRGFLFGAPLALELGVGLIPVRKPGKLPWKTFEESYQLEYGSGTLQIHQDAARPGERVLLVDDVLATGGTAAATAALVRRLGAEVVGAAFVVELEFLHGRQRLHGVETHSLVRIRN